MSAPTFPGGTSVTRLSVYPDRCVDGLAGGTPHLHTVSTEAYVVIGGTGVLQTLDPAGFRETPLRAGSTVWFGPGVIHRAVNRGDLQVVVVMSNAGLPEAGDAVMTFPPEIVADPARYRAAATLPAASAEQAVQRRRDLAVEGFQRLVAGGPEALQAFYDSATALVRPAVDGWRELWAATVERETRHTAAVLDALARGDGRHLGDAALLESPPNDETRWGMCGRLRVLGLARTGDSPPAGAA
jgi:mannose-6-phosphate isomerase-like protein (cupin superfamily)